MKHLCLLSLALLFTLSAYTQTVIGKHHLKDYSITGEIYPYGWAEFGGDLYALANKPVVRLSESEFVYLWKPDFGSKKRRLSCFNMLTEVVWDTEIKLAREEEIFHLYQVEDSIVTLSYRYRWEDKSHTILGRKYKKENGEFIKEEFLHTHMGRENDLIGFDLSPDSSQLIVFHFEHEQKGKNPRNHLQYPIADGQLGFRLANATHVVYAAFDKSLQRIHAGKIQSVVNAKNKSTIIDCQVGNDGHVYTTIFQEPSGLKVIQYHPETENQKELSFHNFPDPFKDAPYAAHLPIMIGASGKAYAAYANREKLRGKVVYAGFPAPYI